MIGQKTVTLNFGAWSEEKVSALWPIIWPNEKAAVLKKSNFVIKHARRNPVISVIFQEPRLARIARELISLITRLNLVVCWLEFSVCVHQRQAGRISVAVGIVCNRTNGIVRRRYRLRNELAFGPLWLPIRTGRPVPSLCGQSPILSRIDAGDRHWAKRL